MSNILVTGGAGYIGSHACKALAAAGFCPVVYDNLSAGHQWAVKWGPLVVGDINDRRRLDEVMVQHQPLAVMHFAAHAYVGESVVAPGKYYRNNVAGTLTLLEAMRDHRCSNMIFSSTCATYGIPELTPITESAPQKPVNPYGSSKLMIETMLADFERAHDLRYISLRYFNAAGADPMGEIGEVHDPETHLIPLVLDAAQGRRSVVEVYGSDYATPDGTAVRDYVHVSDLAAAHVKGLEFLINGNQSSAFNLGVGRGYSVMEVIRVVEAISGKGVPFRRAPRRAGDPPVLVADARRAVEVLQWKPAFSGLESIIESALRWHSVKGKGDS